MKVRRKQKFQFSISSVNWEKFGSIYTIFNSISSNIDEVLLINPPAKVFVFGDFDLYPKDWITYSGGTDRLGEFCYNFSQEILLRWLTFLLRSKTVMLTVLLFWIYLFLLMLVFVLQWLCPPLGNSNHVIVSVSIGFPSYAQRNVPFHRIAYEYSCADWDDFYDHLRDVPWDDIFKLSPSAAASEFCEWVQVGVDICIPNRK